MPYIKQEDKEHFALAVHQLAIAMDNDVTAGDLNYLFTKIAQYYLGVHGKSYQNINDVIGALEGAKLEFYRRLVAPYEDGKACENGDVY